MGHAFHKVHHFNQDLFHHIHHFNNHLLHTGESVLKNPHTLPILQKINMVTTAVILALPTDVIAPGLKQALSAGNMALGSAMKAIQDGGLNQAGLADLQSANSHYKDALDQLPPGTDPKTRQRLEDSQQMLENLLNQRPVQKPSENTRSVANQPAVITKDTPAPVVVPKVAPKKSSGMKWYWIVFIVLGILLLLGLLGGGAYFAMKN